MSKCVHERGSVHVFFISTALVLFLLSGVCSAVGDPHYRTFDGKYYSFMGHCKYLLAEDAIDKSFSVVVDNFPCGPDNSQSCTKTVTVYFNTTNIHLKRGSSVSANGEDLAAFPYKHNGKVVYIL